MPRVSAQHEQAVRDRIVRAAIEVFAEHGFHRATMQDIVRRSGLSVGAIYTYFKSKSELILAGCDLITDQELGELRERLATGRRLPRAGRDGPRLLLRPVRGASAGPRQRPPHDPGLGGGRHAIRRSGRCSAAADGTSSRRPRCSSRRASSAASSRLARRRGRRARARGDARRDHDRGDRGWRRLPARGRGAASARDARAPVRRRRRAARPAPLKCRTAAPLRVAQGEPRLVTVAHVQTVRGPIDPARPRLHAARTSTRRSRSGTSRTAGTTGSSGATSRSSRTSCGVHGRRRVRARGPHAARRRARPGLARRPVGGDRARTSSWAPAGTARRITRPRR